MHDFLLYGLIRWMRTLKYFKKLRLRLETFLMKNIIFYQNQEEMTRRIKSLYGKNK